MNKPPKERFHFLDGLRGIASSMIVFHHAFSSNIYRALLHMHLPQVGYYFINLTQSGVALFFVLSGVVLLRPYLRNQRKFNVIDYFVRRFKRIYPPYFFALLFASFVIWFINTYPTWYNYLGNKMVFSWKETFSELFIINFNGTYYNLAWWSLQIEVLFYLLIPLCIFVFPKGEKINTVRMAVMVASTFAVVTFLQVWLSHSHPGIYTYYSYTANISQSLCYPVCFLMGMLLAAKDFPTRIAKIFVVTGLILVGVSWLQARLLPVPISPIVSSGFGLLYAGIVIFSFRYRSFKRFLSAPFMIWLGERSYSLFLVHFSVFYLVDNLVARITTSRDVYYGILTRGIGITVALFVAMLLFHFVEKKQARGLVTGNMFWPWQVRTLENPDD